MEKNIEHEMDTGGIQGFKELNFRYYIGGKPYIHYYLYPL